MLVLQTQSLQVDELLIQCTRLHRLTSHLASHSVTRVASQADQPQLTAGQDVAGTCTSCCTDPTPLCHSVRSPHSLQADEPLILCLIRRSPPADEPLLLCYRQSLQADEQLIQQHAILYRLTSHRPTSGHLLCSRLNHCRLTPELPAAHPDHSPPQADERLLIVASFAGLLTMT